MSGGSSGQRSIVNRERTDLGAFTWARIHRLYDADPAMHWGRCEAEGLGCPLEVFAQLFHGQADNWT
jgi:hypothetical protein